MPIKQITYDNYCQKSNLLLDIEKTEKLIQSVSAAQLTTFQQSEKEDLSKTQSKHSNQIKISEEIICEKQNSNLPIDLAP